MLKITTRLPWSLPERIYFFRHGESIGNERGLDDNSLQGISNHQFPLTSKGIHQSMELSTYISINGMLHHKDLYVSTFLRTQQTMESVAWEDAENIRPVYVDSRLDEWWKGIFHSLSKEEIDRHYPIERRVLERESWYYYKPPQGESGKDVETRLLSFLSDLRNNCIISGHGRIGGFLKRILCDEAMDVNCVYQNPKNCELWLFKKKDYNYEFSSLFRPKE